LSTESLAKADFSLLTDQGEIDLIRGVGQYPRVIEGAAQAHEPHRVAFYLHELASILHSHWTRGKDQPQLRFVNEGSRDLTVARIGLVAAVTSVLASGLSILGVKAPDEMR
jgi:arginyl-tRNA synthetase